MIECSFRGLVLTRSSSLYAHEDLRTSVLEHVLPPTLQRLLPLNTILERLPENYAKAIFNAEVPIVKFNVAIQFHFDLNLFTNLLFVSSHVLDCCVLCLQQRHGGQRLRLLRVRADSHQRSAGQAQTSQ